MTRPSARPRLSPRPGPRSAAPPAPSPSPPASASAAGAAAGEALSQELAGLCYALDAPPRRHGRRSIVSVRLAGADPGPALVDRCDLYSFRSRRGLAQLVAEGFGRRVDEVLSHLALLLDAAERAAPRERGPGEGPALDGPRRAAAEALLSEPDLLARAAGAMETLGHVGEEGVKRLCYLVATSRLLARPLSALLLAPPGAGKSAVLEAVEALLPKEQVVSLARLTAQSLYYMGQDALRHRLVLVDELEGQLEAAHAIRVLQSKGELTLTATVRGRAEPFRVRGPVAVMSGSTSGAIDPQNLSRCLVLPLDDGPEQTRRVQEAQRRAWAGLLGPRAEGERQRLQDAQRLLEPLEVLIPFATRLRFPAGTARARRDHAKLGALIAAHALLHQRQRARDERGRVVATPADYRAVFELVAGLVAAEREGLSPRALRLYRRLAEAEAATAGDGLTRRELAGALSWSYATTRRALEELSAEELVVASQRAKPVRYRLLDRSLLAGGSGLLPPEAL